jgi:N-acyl-D-amino-acid deacylase
MIRKMTSLPADRYFIQNKGKIKENYDADFLVFDYDRLTDKATYADPTLLSEGFHVIVNGGQIIYEDGKMTGAVPGQVLRHKSSAAEHAPGY